jgi:hypothetical protein
METSPGCPESSSPPQPRPRGGGPREATRSHARCPTLGRAAFPSPDLSAARRELQVLLCDSVFLDVHHLPVQEVINYGLLLVREVLRLLRCSLLCLELGTNKSSLALYQSCTSMWNVWIILEIAVMRILVNDSIWLLIMLAPCSFIFHFSWTDLSQMCISCNKWCRHHIMCVSWTF